MKFLDLLKEIAKEQQPLQEMDTESLKSILATVLAVGSAAWNIHAFLKIKDYRKQLEILRKIAGTDKYKNFIARHPKGEEIERRLEKILRGQENIGIGTDRLKANGKELPKFSPN